MIVREKDYFKLREKINYKLEADEIECPNCKGYGDMVLDTFEENVIIILCTKCSGTGKIEWLQRIKNNDPKKIMGTYN